VRQRDGRTWCRRAVMSTNLSPPLAASLGFPASDSGDPAGWGRAYRRCVRAFAHERKRLPKPPRWSEHVRIDRVRVARPEVFAPEVSRVARVRIVQTGGELTVLKFHGAWKVVFAVN
jgi:hypothetical protein